MKIGSQLNAKLREELTKFLLKNLDIFAQIHLDMEGIDLHVMCHHLNIYLNQKGIRQKHRPMSGERVVALKEEVDRLLDVGLIK